MKKMRRIFITVISILAILFIGVMMYENIQFDFDTSAEWVIYPEEYESPLGKIFVSLVIVGTIWLLTEATIEKIQEFISQYKR